MDPCDTALDNDGQDCRTLIDDRKAECICALPRIRLDEAGVQNRSVGASGAVVGAQLLCVLLRSSVLHTRADHN